MHGTVEFGGYYIMLSFSEVPLHTAIISGFLAFLIVLFVSLFLIPAVWQSVKLSRYTKRLRRADTKDLEALSALFKGD